ncbi:VOC family protein [Halobacillus trueperi]|uniref:VOC family protein n=1 Tax=Halobacillus trueperi TaxID=156205 RepID=A0A3E0J3G0_9BACI|nr:VOC family protein [Halobacillus trueperi]REJ07410.1 VOC family protein [Halobacillus trueperi]
MLSKVGQIMLYVNNQEESVNFWKEKLGFVVVSEENNGKGMRWIEVGPKEGVETTIVLHNKEVVAKMSPDLNLDPPSLMFFTDHFEQLHRDLLNRKVTVGEIVPMPTGRVFNFADNEDQYFAVMENK